MGINIHKEVKTWKYIQKQVIGQTSLYDGTRVDKDSIRVESYGTIDELNSYIGLCMHYINEDEKKVLFNIQRDLFYIGSELATKKYRETKTK
mgnify:CR=1 FL=1